MKKIRSKYGTVEILEINYPINLCTSYVCGRICFAFLSLLLSHKHISLWPRCTTGMSPS